MSTLYMVLGVAQDVSHAEIKKAYHLIVLRHHPDKSANISEGEKAVHEAITKRANSAWEALGHPQRRKEYDKTELRSAKRQKRNDCDPYNTTSGYDYSPSDSNSDSGQHTSEPPCTPLPQQKYPRTLKVLSHDWTMSIMVEGDYKPYQWGPGGVYCKENRIFIYMKIRETVHFNACQKPNVSIEVTTTPGMQRIHKIESLYKRRMQPEGLDEQLLVTVFLEPNTKNQFREMDQYDTETRSFGVLLGCACKQVGLKKLSKTTTRGDHIWYMSPFLHEKTMSEGNVRAKARSS